MEYYLQLLLFLAVFAVIIILALFSTRFIAARAGKIMKGRHLKIIESISLGTDKKLHLLKAGERFFLISSCGRKIELVSEVELNDFEDREEDRPAKAVSKGLNLFKSVFASVSNQYNGLGKQKDSERFKKSLQKMKAINKNTREKGESGKNEEGEEIQEKK